MTVGPRIHPGLSTVMRGGALVAKHTTHMSIIFHILGLYIAFYLCVMACYAMMSVPYNGLIADQTPPSQRGTSFKL